MSCTVKQPPNAWRVACRRCSGACAGGPCVCGIAGPVWAAALGGCEWMECWKVGRSMDDAVLDLVRRLADAPLPDPPKVLKALLGHTLDEVLLRGLTALYSVLGMEEQQQQPDGGSDGAAVSATWLAGQYRQLAEDEQRYGTDDPSIRERQGTLDQLAQLLRQKESLQEGDAALSTDGTTSWEPSPSTSAVGAGDLAGATSSGDPVSSAASTVQEAAPRRVSSDQDRQREEENRDLAAALPGWILPGVIRSDELIENADDERDGEQPGDQRHSTSSANGRQPAAATPPCDCCRAPRIEPPPMPAPPGVRAPCVCPCGIGEPEFGALRSMCVGEDGSSEYFTGLGSSAMPSRSNAVSPSHERQPSDLAAASAEQHLSEGDIFVDGGGSGLRTSSKLRDVRASSPRTPASAMGGDVASPETDWHSAMSTPRRPPTATPVRQPSPLTSTALWPRATPCPCCPPRRRRPRVPTIGPEQILWAITKICIFPDASRTYEVLKPSFEKPPKASGRTHVVFAMKPP